MIIEDVPEFYFTYHIQGEVPRRKNFPIKSYVAVTYNLLFQAPEVHNAKTVGNVPYLYLRKDTF